jgi:hypothetical protein
MKWSTLCWQDAEFLMLMLVVHTLNTVLWRVNRDIIRWTVNVNSYNLNKSWQWILGARGSVVGWGTILQAGRSAVRVPDKVDFFNLPNLSSRTMALVSTQSLTKVAPGIFLGVKSGRRLGLTTLPPFVCRMSENVGAWTSRKPKGLHGMYTDNFTFYSEY